MRPIVQDITEQTMTDPKLHFTGGVEDGKLKLSNRKDFDLMLTQFEGKRIEGYIWRQRKRRSNNQNAYLWACVYPILVQGFKDMGHENITVNVVHEWAKNKFIEPDSQEWFEVVSTDSGEVALVEMPTTRKLTTTEMMGYIASIQKWAAEFLGVSIPDPTPLFGIE